LPMRGGNNLSYVRRCLVSRMFHLPDVAKGMPLQTFYKGA
jgi:hypothetical protein